MKKRLLVLLLIFILIFLVTSVLLANDDNQVETIILRGAGEDIWANNISFQFVYVEVEGDLDIKARIMDFNINYEVNIWENKYGIMIREGLQDVNPQLAYFTFLSANSLAVHAQRERGSGSTGTARATLPEGAELPVWIRLRREGDNFAAFYSVEEEPDMFDWIIFSNTKVEMGEKVNVGLMASKLGSGGYVEYADIIINGEQITFDDWEDNISVGTDEIGEMEKGTWNK